MDSADGPSGSSREHMSSMKGHANAYCVESGVYVSGGPKRALLGVHAALAATLLAQLWSVALASHQTVSSGHAVLIACLGITSCIAAFLGLWDAVPALLAAVPVAGGAHDGSSHACGPPPAKATGEHIRPADKNDEALIQAVDTPSPDSVHGSHANDRRRRRAPTKYSSFALAKPTEPASRRVLATCRSFDEITNGLRSADAALLDAAAPIDEQDDDDTGASEEALVTPADLMLDVINDLMEGRQPNVLELQELASAVTAGGLYQPITLQQLATATNIDADVQESLMLQLGVVNTVPRSSRTDASAGAAGHGAPPLHADGNRDSPRCTPTGRNRPPHSSSPPQTVGLDSTLVLLLTGGIHAEDMAAGNGTDTASVSNTRRSGDGDAEDVHSSNTRPAGEGSKVANSGEPEGEPSMAQLASYFHMGDEWGPDGQPVTLGEYNSSVSLSALADGLERGRSAPGMETRPSSSLTGMSGTAVQPRLQRDGGPRARMQDGSSQPLRMNVSFSLKAEAMPLSSVVMEEPPLPLPLPQPDQPRAPNKGKSSRRMSCPVDQQPQMDEARLGILKRGSRFIDQLLSGGSKQATDGKPRRKSMFASVNGPGGLFTPPTSPRRNNDMSHGDERHSGEEAAVMQNNSMSLDGRATLAPHLEEPGRLSPMGVLTHCPCCGYDLSTSEGAVPECPSPSQGRQRRASARHSSVRNISRALSGSFRKLVGKSSKLAADEALTSFRQIDDDAGESCVLELPATEAAFTTGHHNKPVLLPIVMMGTGMGVPGSSVHALSQPCAVSPGPVLFDQVERLLAQAESAVEFDTFELARVTSGHPLSSLAFHLLQRGGLIETFQLDAIRLARWLRVIEGGYLPNPYHNAVHAADVLQTLHILLHLGGLVPHYADPITLLACYLAAVVHDYEHLGVTNDFLVNTSNELAIRYNDKAPMENHHLAAAFTSMRIPANSFAAAMSKPEYNRMRSIMVDLVLATDMKQHFGLLGHFNSARRRGPRLTAEQAPTLGDALHAQQSARSVMAGSLPNKLSTQIPYEFSHSRSTLSENFGSKGSFTRSSRPSWSVAPNMLRGASLLSQTSSQRSVRRPLTSARLQSASPSLGLSGLNPISSHTSRSERSSHTSPAFPPSPGRTGGPPDAAHQAKLSKLSQVVALATHMHTTDAVGGPLRTSTEPLTSSDLNGPPSDESNQGQGSSRVQFAPGSEDGQDPAAALAQRSLSVARQSRSSGNVLGRVTTLSGHNSRQHQPGNEDRVSMAGSSVVGPSVFVGNALSDSHHGRDDEEEQVEEMIPLDDTERLLSIQIAFKCADLGHLAEARDVHLRWVAALEEEFYHQGDREREAGLTISALCDRTKPGVTKSQVGFFEVVVLPLYKAFANAFPGTRPVTMGALNNFKYWKARQRDGEITPQASKPVDEEAG